MGQHTVLVKPKEANSFMHVSSVLLNNSRKNLKEAHLKNEMSVYKNKTEIEKAKKQNATHHKTGDEVIKFSKWKKKKKGGGELYGIRKRERQIMVSTHKELTTFSPFKPKSLTSSMKLA
jgi:hypothetical protein